MQALLRLLLNAWTRVPLVAINLVAAGTLLGYVLSRSADYLSPATLGTWVRLPDGTGMRVPLSRVLVDLTFVTMGASFLLRRPPRERNTHVPQIVIGALGGMFPMLPYFVDGALATVKPEWRAGWKPLFMEPMPAWWRSVGAVVFMSTGNALDAWSYVLMRRSFSVVPEARELVTHGPFRWLRHPVYTGQLLSQAGIWLFLATAHGGWLLFYVVFVCIQLYRARAEEGVLSAAFGDAYREHAERTWWILPARITAGVRPPAGH